MAYGPILLGVIGRPHGVRGHLHVHSYATRPEDLCAYGTLTDAQGRAYALHWVGAGIAAVEEIEGGVARPITDRAAAERLTNRQLFIDRALLPEPEADSFYLADLIGLDAFDPSGRPLGAITAVHDYGAGASLELGALLVPFTRACVPNVDPHAGRLTICLPEELVAEDTALAPVHEAAQ
jgi:16S rRNA processing protein RimM